MILVYVAGPFRAPTPWGIAENVRAAERIGLEVAKLGAMPVIPHANTALFHGSLPDQFFLDGTMELLRRCDAILLMPKWMESHGAQAECREAYSLGLVVLNGVEELRSWISVGAPVGSIPCKVCGKGPNRGKHATHLGEGHDYEPKA